MASEGAMSVVDRARRDPAVFAELLVGQSLWPHQRAVAASAARWRMVCAGRQVGKSRMLAIIALHKGFSSPRSMVLVVSSGETASKRLLEEVATLATSAPLLQGSVVDESSKAVVLSNGSTIRSVPASQAQIRGWAVDLLIVDEAAFIDQEIWRAAEPAIIARPGSRVILCSSPWGPADGYFKVLWERGRASPDQTYESWHWPSSTSPLVSAELLAEIREREEDRYFRREFLAEWTDDAGAYFSEAELRDAVGGFEMVSPDDEEAAGLGGVAAGVDWGFAHDANALAVIAARPLGLEDRGRPRFWVPWVEAVSSMPYAEWIERIVAASSVGGGHYAMNAVVCELNGVGQMPSQVLERRMAELGAPGVVVPTFTDARLKETAFGYLKLLMQQGRLELPNDPTLLKQLRSLQFEQRPSGVTSIAVPERLGHDDAAMALALAATAVLGHDLPLVDDRVYGVEDLDLGWDDEFGVQRFGSY
jgi:hypothetical protein